MKKIIGKVSQINMFILVLALLFVLFNFLLMKVITNQTIGQFYLREIVSLLISLVVIKLFFKFENRYEEEK